MISMNVCWCIRRLGGKGITIQTAAAPVNSSVRYSRLREEEQEDSTSSQRTVRTSERQKCWRWCASQGSPPHSLCDMSQVLCAEASLSTSSASGEGQRSRTAESGSPELRPSPRVCRGHHCSCDHCSQVPCQSRGCVPSSSVATEDSYLRDYPPVSSATSTPVNNNNSSSNSWADSLHHVAPSLHLSDTNIRHQRADTNI